MCALGFRSVLPVYSVTGNGILPHCEDLRGDRLMLADLSTHLRRLMLTPSSLPVQLLVQIPLQLL